MTTCPLILMPALTESRYAAMDFFQEKFIAAFTDLGCEVRLCETLTLTPADIARGFYFYIGAKAANDLQRMASTFPRWTIVNYIIDHPLYYVPLRDCPPCYLPVAMDTTWAAFMNRYLTPVKPPVLALAHAGYSSQSLSAPPPPMAPRGIEVLFSASIEDPAAIRGQWQSELPTGAEVLDAVTDGHYHPLRHEFLDLAQLLEQGLSFDVREHWEFFRRIWVFADKYRRAWRRLACLRQLAEAGIPVTCYVNQPELLAKLIDRPSLDIQPAISFAAILDKMREAKIVLTTLPHATSERIPSAMLSGALSLSDSSPMLSEAFAAEREAVFFRWGELDSLPARVGELLHDPEHMQRIAVRGREKALANHTVAHHARAILRMVTQFKQFRGLQ